MEGRLVVFNVQSLYDPDDYNIHMYYVTQIDTEKNCYKDGCYKRGMYVFHWLCGSYGNSTIICSNHAAIEIGRSIDPMEDFINYAMCITEVLAHTPFAPKNIVFRIGYLARQYVTPTGEYTPLGLVAFPTLILRPKKLGMFVGVYTQTCDLAKRSISLLWKLRKQLGRDIIRLISRILWSNRSAWVQRIKYGKGYAN